MYRRVFVPTANVPPKLFNLLEGLEKQNKNKNKTKQKQTKNDKKKTITQSTSQKKIGEGHSIERVWYNSASRELSDTLPGSQPCTQTRSVYNSSVLSEFQVSI